MMIKIIVIDDADALVGPKAPEIAINILKAALDSTADDEGRLVSFGTFCFLGVLIFSTLQFGSRFSRILSPNPLCLT